MAALELIDETFNENRTESYELSVQFRTDGFAFAIRDAERNTFIALVDLPLSVPIIDHDTDWEAALATLAAAYPYLLRRYKRVSVWMHNAPCTFVPEALLAPDNAKALLELVHPVPPTYELHLSPMQFNGQSAIEIAGVPSALAAEWLRLQPQSHFVATMGHLAYRGYVCPWDTYLLLELDGEARINAVLFDSGKPLAVNTFSVKSPADALYYAIGFARSQNLDVVQLPVKMVGSHPQEADIVALFQRYFREVATGIIYNHALFAYRLNKQGSSYFCLFNR